MGRCRDEIASSIDAPYLSPERDRVVADLSQPEKDRLRSNIHTTNILFQGLPRDVYKLINHNMDAKDIWDNVKMLLKGSELTKDDLESQLYDEFEEFRQHKGENIHDYYIRGAHNRVGNDNVGQGKPIKCYNFNGIGHIAKNCNQPKRPHNSDYFKEKKLLMQAQKNGVDLDEERLLFLAADQCDAFDSDVDESPTAQTMFMASLSFAARVYNEVGPLYDSNTLFKDNEAPIVQSDASFVPNDTEIVKPNHARVLIHDLEETLEITETTRKQMIAKMNDPECVKKKSDDLLKMKAKALKVKAKSAQPISSMMVKVIPYFKTLKEHFEGIHKALIKEIKEMKEVFDQMEAEVHEHAVDKKCYEIERKNLLENENLIAECMSKDLFYTATNYVLTSQNKDLTVKVNAFQDLYEHFRIENEKVKQCYKELYGSIKLAHAKTIVKTTYLLDEIENLKAQLKNNIKCLTVPAENQKCLPLKKLGLTKH
nr:retrovirus-related Pol polyprotein from transposon TNT 1-94 [Tanacetum cinerariifolium]